MPMVESLSKHPVCGSHNPRGGTPLYKLYGYVQTVQGRQRRGQSSGSVRSGIWRSTGRILTSTVVMRAYCGTDLTKVRRFMQGIS